MMINEDIKDDAKKALELFDAEICGKKL